MVERNVVDRNVRFLIHEIFWAAIYTACLSFSAAFLIRLGGSNLMVSLLSSGAALVSALLSIPFAAFLERRTKRKPWIVGSLSVVRLGYLAMIGVPWLAPSWQPLAMMSLILVLNIPAALAIAGWLPLLADVLPLERRASVFSMRNITLGATVSVATLILGKWLDLTPFPFNYQGLYVLGVITSMLSTLYVKRMIIPDSPVVENAKATGRLTLAGARMLLVEQRPFTNIVVNTLLFNISAWMLIPLQSIYFVRVLGASDGWLGLCMALANAGTIIGNLLWRRIIDQRGLSWVLISSTMLSAIYFFLIGLIPDLTLILLFAFLSGVINPGIDLSHLSVLLEICPAQRRAMYLGVFSTIMNIGFFLAPLAVAPLLDLLSAQILLVVLGVMRLAGAILFAVNPVRLPERSMTAPA